MLFNSIDFFVLIAITFAIYYSAQGSANLQVMCLIVASFVFYGYHNPYPIALLMAVALVTAGGSYLIARGAALRGVILFTGVALCLGTLAFFKYKGLVIVPILPEGGTLGVSLLTIGLPIGISFYTFQSISLLVDARRDPQSVIHDSVSPFQHLRDSVFFVAFFPQLVAGPIMKAHDFMPQIARKRVSQIDWRYVVETLIAGYFLKVFVADNLARYTVVLPFRSQWEGLGSGKLLSLLVGYSAQIYADFAGYSLIAIGVAALFGYRLMQNFNFPYISRSFSEFWRRWHISLSTWLKEYLYFPLGGNRRGAARTYINLLIVMALGGIWHGAAWKYAIWGLWHGSALAIERMLVQAAPIPAIASGGATGRLIKAAGGALRWAIVFTVVTLGWLFFSLGSIADVLPYLSRIVNWTPLIGGAQRGEVAVIYALASIVALHHVWYLVNSRTAVLRPLLPAAYGLMIVLTAVAGGTSNAFIYFQF